MVSSVVSLPKSFNGCMPRGLFYGLTMVDICRIIKRFLTLNDVNLWDNFLSIDLYFNRSDIDSCVVYECMHARRSLYYVQINTLWNKSVL